MGHFLLVRGMHKLFAASCCDSGGRTRDGRGRNREGERQRGGEESEKEWTLQSDLKFIFNQASSSQTTMLLGAKRHNFTETNLKTGLESSGGRQVYKHKQTNKPCNLTVTLKKSNFLWIKFSAALKNKSLTSNFCTAVKFIFDRYSDFLCSFSVNMKCYLLW